MKPALLVSLCCLLVAGACIDIGKQEPEGTCSYNSGALYASESVAKNIASVTATGGPCTIYCPNNYDSCDYYRITTTEPGTCTFTVEFKDGREPEVLKMVFEEGPIERCCHNACRVGDGLIVPEPDAG
jgi:hypothetical protein